VPVLNTLPDPHSPYDHATNLILHDPVALHSGRMTVEGSFIRAGVASVVQAESEAPRSRCRR
jgi:hypothetical protein